MLPVKNIQCAHYAVSLSEDFQFSCWCTEQQFNSQPTCCFLEKTLGTKTTCHVKETGWTPAFNPFNLLIRQFYLNPDFKKFFSGRSSLVFSIQLVKSKQVDLKSPFKTNVRTRRLESRLQYHVEPWRHKLIVGSLLLCLPCCLWTMKRRKRYIDLHHIEVAEGHCCYQKLMV